jgi:hypothetical protein
MAFEPEAFSRDYKYACSYAPEIWEHLFFVVVSDFSTGMNYLL